jgi:hypothetical protein
MAGEEEKAFRSKRSNHSRGTRENSFQFLLTPATGPLWLFSLSIFRSIRREIFTMPSQLGLSSGAVSYVNMMKNPDLPARANIARGYRKP